MRARRRPLGPLLAATLAAGGCGWHAGLAAPDGVRTVGVEILRTERGVLERGLETRLHRELTRAVSDLVQAPLAAPAEADLVLRGTITDYRRRSGIRSADNELLETAVRIGVRAELVDRRSGRPVGPPAVVEEAVWSGYALDEPGNEAPARDRALRYLAESLVLDLFHGAAAADAAPPSG